jgi:hypothetical protein
MSRSRKIVIVAAVLALIALPVSNVLANHVFSDVPTSAFYHNSVTAIANAGITGGCGGTKYCPNSAVTRGQMAVFLDRVANLRGEKLPIVDAFSLFGQIILNDTETLTLTGTPTATECLESIHGVPPASAIEYVISADLMDAPVTTSTVNVSVDDPDLEDEVFDVCFTIIGGAGLPTGDYEMALNLTMFVGSGIFATANARNSAVNFIQSWKH